MQKWFYKLYWSIDFHKILFRMVMGHLVADLEFMCTPRKMSHGQRWQQSVSDSNTNLAMLAQISCINKYVIKNHTNIHTEVGKEKAELDFTCTPRESDLLKDKTLCVCDSDQKEVKDIKISSLWYVYMICLYHMLSKHFVLRCLGWVLRFVLIWRI